MRPTLIKAALMALVPLSTTTSAAEPLPADTVQKLFVLPSGSVPEQIFGNDCVQKPGDETFAPMLVCEPKKITENPVVTVSVVDSNCEKTSEQMMSERRASMNDGTPFFNVVWERSFSPPSVQNATGYRAFYQKSMGNRYWWETCGQGRLTRVSVIMFAKLDNEALKAEIEEKIFGVVPLSQHVSQDVKQ